MSVRKLPSGKWKAEVWFKNQRICSKTFSIKALAEKFERTRIQELELLDITGSKAQDYSYKEVFEFWYADASQRKRSTSLVKDEQMNRDFISPIIGNLKISEINQLHFQKIVDGMIALHSKSSINKVIQHFKAVLNYSFTHELISKNPAKNVKQFKLHKKEMAYLSKEELNKLITHTHHKYLGEERWKHVLYLTLFLTGERLGEVLALQWDQIYFEEEAIIVNKIWCSKENKIVNTTKGKKDLRIPLNSLLKKELASLKNTRTGDFVFTQAGDRPVDASNFRNRIWFKDLHEAGVKRIRIHDSRHTFASHFMMNGGDIYDLKMLLNHSSVSVTEKYAKLSNKHLARTKDLVMPTIQLEDNLIHLKKSVEGEQPRQIPALKLDESKYRM